MESELKAAGNRWTATRVELYARRYKSLVSALLDLDRRYPVLRFRPKDITAEEVRLFEDVLRYVNTSGVLPPSPDGPAGEPVAPSQSGGTLGNRELQST
jgi:Ser/Thr protein kinase RdoA (MazF antagonist)